MRRAHRRHTAVTLAASVAIHAVVLAVVAMQSPTLVIPEGASGPPTPIIPILILPKAPPAEPGGPPRPVNLHQRALRHAETPPPIAPLVTPKAEVETKAPSNPTLDAFKVRPEPAARDVQTALRGRVGCANPDAAGLTQAERDACNQALGAGAADAPFAGLGLNRDKSRALDAAAAQREADYRYKRMIPPSAPRMPGAPLEYDVQRSPPNGASNMGAGVSSEDLGAEKAVKKF